MLLCPWDSPGKDSGVGCQALLQGIFLTQGSNLGLQHCRQILYILSHQGSPIFMYIIHPLSGVNPYNTLPLSEPPNCQAQLVGH